MTTVFQMMPYIFKSLNTAPMNLAFDLVVNRSYA